MGYNGMFRYMNTMCNDQIRIISTSIISNIDHIFVKKTFKNLLFQLLDKYVVLLLAIVAPLCARAPGFIAPKCNWIFNNK